jgi:hypothetical protein
MSFCGSVEGNGPLNLLMRQYHGPGGLHKLPVLMRQYHGPGGLDKLPDVHI